MKHKLANGCLLILGLIIFGMLTIFINSQKEVTVSYTHLTLPTTPYV